jgi:hypothetical protein
MSIENRKSRRRIVQQPALILNGDGSICCLCMIEDVSATGAKLKLQTPYEVTDEFTLKLSKNGNVHRKCKVSWRSRNSIGIHFIVAQATNTVRF